MVKKNDVLNLYIINFYLKNIDKSFHDNYIELYYIKKCIRIQTSKIFLLSNIYIYDNYPILLPEKYK